MFTGIVQTKGTVISIAEKDNFLSIVISVPAEHMQHLNHGASIAINGVCLTVVKYELHNSDVVGQVYFDVIDETLKLTNLSQIKQGDKVNVERSMTFGTELGGHIVSGHIQTQAKIVLINKTQSNCEFILEVPQQWMKYIIHKGFIAIDGISLTVGKVENNRFSLHLIPETLNITTLGTRQEGDLVNIEVDQQTMTIVTTIERYMAQARPALEA
ncbi:riboflavin synthase subunit alpha [Flocculibacter collagenilyticus]|uniref:riboflavin synthase subunit alpha n=1 Tax=Flocculibacter collagenilyticus TaxID=2744479 RepID=UPI0018F6F091|nr:riboflavin synthase subunit alpha [Flocculibacter collagenilyticus]